MLGRSIVQDFSTYIQDEIPSGAVNGVNDLFTLAQVPIINTLSVYLNGLKITLDVDYVINGSELTISPAPDAGDLISCEYNYL